MSVNNKQKCACLRSLDPQFYHYNIDDMQEDSYVLSDNLFDCTFGLRCVLQSSSSVNINCIYQVKNK